MKGLGNLRKFVKARRKDLPLAAIAKELYWSERSMRRALNAGGRIPPHVVAYLSCQDDLRNPATGEKV